MKIESILRRASSDSEIYTRDYSGMNIYVVGVGGAGSNIISRLNVMGIEGVKTIVVHTDLAHLKHTDADEKVLLKNTGGKFGYGTGGNPEIGERSAILARNKLYDVVKDADILFLIAGLGGGTGTGVAPVIAELAKKSGALVISIVTLPFEVERAVMKTAKAGLKVMMEKSSTVIVLENTKLLKIAPKKTLEEAFMIMDHLIGQVIISVVDTITKPSLINLDFTDLKTIMQAGGTSTILYGDGKIDNIRNVIIETLNNPLMDVDYSGGNGALIHLTVGPSASIKRVYDIVDIISSELKKDANIVFGARIDLSLEDKIRVMCIITGVHILTTEPMVEKAKLEMMERGDELEIIK